METPCTEVGSSGRTEEEEAWEGEEKVGFVLQVLCTKCFAVSKGNWQVPGVHVGDLEWKYQCMSYLPVKGFPGLQTSLHHVSSSTLNNLKIIFFDRKSGRG